LKRNLVGASEKKKKKNVEKARIIQMGVNTFRRKLPDRIKGN